MLYVLFFILALLYNVRKFYRERTAFLTSLIEAKNSSHQEMILGHHFHVFILEVFMALIVAHLISERAFVIGIMGLGFVYLVLLGIGMCLYRYFIKYIERSTHLSLWASFKTYVIKEFRVSFALIMLPILIYSVINWTFQDSVYEEWGNLWFIGLLFNILFVSVLTIVCTVIIMLRLIPNREITEPEYLEIIQKRLNQIQMPTMRVQWIETDVKNAFIVGLKLLRFSNQTMFIGRKLRETLTFEEFDAVICHELAHVANRHVHKRMIDLMKNLISIIIGIGILMAIIIGFSLVYWGEDASLYTQTTSGLSVMACLGWIIFNYVILFDTIRSHEYEADAFAVMKLGASFPALVSSLEKLSTPEEIPEYLKFKTNQNRQKGWFGKMFSTHPELKERIDFLKLKIEMKLPFNHYVSRAQKIRTSLGHLFQWRVALPLTFMFAFVMVWTVTSYREGQQTIAYLQKADTQSILSNPDLIKKINARPLLIGHSLMFHIVKKGEPILIDHFLKNGANKGKTLVYLSQTQNFDLLQKYYSLYQDQLTEDEYFLILRKTAQLNFTDGYRYLVNAKRFDSLNPDYKEDVSRLLHNTSKERRPASVRKP